MMGYQAASQLVGPEDAKDILESSRYEKQRRMRADHMKNLAHAMTEGNFRQGTTIDIAMVGDQGYLVNGQHTLSAICHSGRPQMLSIVRHDCKDMDEVGVLYVSFDRHLRRTPLDSMMGFGVDLGGMEVGFTRSLYGATGLAGIGFASHVVAARLSWWSDIRARVQLVESWMPEAREIYRDIGKAPYSSMVRLVPALAVALVTYRFAENASIFWKGLAEDDGLQKGDPRRLLLYAYADKKRFNATTWRQYEISRYVSSCWNSFRRGEMRTSMRHGDTARPIVIVDTPHSFVATVGYMDKFSKPLHMPEPYQRQDLKE